MIGSDAVTVACTALPPGLALSKSMTQRTRERKIHAYHDHVSSTCGSPQSDSELFMTKSTKICGRMTEQGKRASLSTTDVNKIHQESAEKRVVIY